MSSMETPEQTAARLVLEDFDIDLPCGSNGSGEMAMISHAIRDAIFLERERCAKIADAELGEGNWISRRIRKGGDQT